MYRIVILLWVRPNLKHAPKSYSDPLEERLELLIFYKVYYKELNNKNHCLFL